MKIMNFELIVVIFLNIANDFRDLVDTMVAAEAPFRAAPVIAMNGNLIITKSRFLPKTDLNVEAKM